MRRMNVLVITALVIVLIVVSGCLFVVREGQEVILLRLGKLKRGSDQAVVVLDPGLHFKWPFIERLYRFDVRLQTYEPQPSRIMTGEQKELLVDFYVKWRINNPGLYYQRTSGSLYRTQQLLKQQVNDKLRAEFGHRTIKDVVAEERLKIMQDLTQLVNDNATNLGLQVIDVRIKRIDLPTAVENGVFERMRSARRVVAAKHRETGRADAEAILATADATAVLRVAKARKVAADTRAKGDEIAAKIYADTYKKDTGFYEFYRGINAYRNVFANKKDMLVLRPDSQFFKYFSDINGRQEGH